MEGRSVIVVCNLKAAKLAGFPSNGMVLCASSEDRSTVAFVEPPAEAVPGAPAPSSEQKRLEASIDPNSPHKSHLLF